MVPLIAFICVLEPVCRKKKFSIEKPKIFLFQVFDLRFFTQIIILQQCLDPNPNFFRIRIQPKLLDSFGFGFGSTTLFCWQALTNLGYERGTIPMKRLNEEDHWNFNITCNTGRPQTSHIIDCVLGRGIYNCPLAGVYSRGSRFWNFFGFSISYSLQLMGKTILRLKYKRCFSLFSCLPMRKWVF
jgi:hypothetical protein